MELVKTQANYHGMSSKKIAERTGKDHKNVIRDIKTMIADLEKDGSNLSHNDYQELKDQRGYVSEILLNERLTLCLASGYSTAVRMNLIDDWADMKRQPGNGFETPKTYIEALKELTQSLEAKEKLQIELQAARPAVDFYNAVTDSKDAIAIGEVAKILDMGYGQNKLFQFLRDQHILSSKNQPYQQYIDCGYFRVIEQKYTGKDGTAHINIKTLVFQKGLDYIRKLIIKQRAA